MVRTLNLSKTVLCTWCAGFHPVYVLCAYTCVLAVATVSSPFAVDTVIAVVEVREEIIPIMKCVVFCSCFIT